MPRLLEWLDEQQHVVTRLTWPAGSGPHAWGLRNCGSRSLCNLVVESGHPEIGLARLLAGPYQRQLPLGSLAPSAVIMAWVMTNEGRGWQFTEGLIHAYEASEGGCDESDSVNQIAEND